jgi:hypothetical protein
MRGIKVRILPLNSPHPNPLHQEREFNLTDLPSIEGIFSSFLNNFSRNKIRMYLIEKPIY